MTRRLLALLFILLSYLGIYLLNSYQKNSLKYAECDSLYIVSFGPSEVFRGENFNVQPSGESAIWIKLNANSRTTYGIAYINGTPLRTVVMGDMVTAAVPETIYKVAGTYPLTVALRLSLGMCRVPSKAFNVISR